MHCHRQFHHIHIHKQTLAPFSARPIHRIKKRIVVLHPLHALPHERLDYHPLLTHASALIGRTAATGASAWHKATTLDGLRCGWLLLLPTKGLGGL